MSAPTTALGCGHAPTPDSGIGTGYARDVATGRTMCYGCADSAAAAEMSTGDRIAAYIGSAGDTVTTWSGGVLARVVGHTTSRTGWHGSEIHYWGARDASGNYWYGRNGGPGMVVNLRRAVV